MRNFLFFVVLFSFAKLNAQPSAVPTTDEILQPAFAKAAAKNKKVLVIFHASWCGWCRKMDASLQDNAVKPLIDRYYETVHLTVYEATNKKSLENKGALEFLTKLGGADKGLPYWYVLDKDGAVLSDSQYNPGKNTGCPASEEEVAYFINVLKQTTSLSEVDLQVIQKRFRQNE
jgi:thiol-disulfide isomerase/thioredoxin